MMIKRLPPLACRLRSGSGEVVHGQERGRQEYRIHVMLAPQMSVDTALCIRGLPLSGEKVPPSGFNIRPPGLQALVN